MDLYGKPYKRDWMAKAVSLIQMLPTFGGRCNRYFWDIRLKILRLPNFNMLFQLVLTKFFISELFLCLPTVGHVIKSCKEPIPIVPIPPRGFVILFWKCCKCPTLGPGSSYKNPTMGFKTVCKCLTPGSTTPKFHFPVYLSCICHIYGPHRAATYFCLEVVRELDLFGSLPVPSSRRVASYPAM